MCAKLHQSVVCNEADLLLKLNKVKHSVVHVCAIAFACVQHMQIEN